MALAGPPAGETWAPMSMSAFYRTVLVARRPGDTHPASRTHPHWRTHAQEPRRRGRRRGARRPRGRPRVRTGLVALEGLRLGAEGRALRRPHAHDHAVDPGV